MRWKAWALSVAGLAATIVSAQKIADPLSSSTAAHVIRVRIAHTGGFCGGGYCSSSTTVEPSFIISELTDSSDEKKWPDKKGRRSITKQEWENLRRAIDTKALASLPQRVCHLDLPCTWAVIEFSDGTKISVSYYETGPPAPIAALLRALPSDPVQFKLPARSN